MIRRLLGQTLLDLASACARTGSGAGISKGASRLVRYAGLLRHPGRHAAVRAAVAGPGFSGIRRLQPQLTFKYLHPRYLLRQAGPDLRAALFVHHYAVLRARLPEAALRGMLDDGIELWRAESEAGVHTIGLRFSHPTDNEGELSLDYALAGEPVSVLSFGFAPGSALGSPAESAVLVSRLQRAKGCGDAYRAATRSMRGLAPSSALLAALTGWVEPLGVTGLVGVSAGRQVCIDDGDAAAFQAVYDAFWSALGGTAEDGLFHLPLRPAEKPLAEVKPGNRARTRAQRDIKAAIAAAARGAGHALSSEQRRGPPEPGGVTRDGSSPVGRRPAVMVFTSAFAQERDGSQARAAALLDRLASRHAAVIVYSHADHDASPWTPEARRAFAARWPTVELALERHSPLLSRVAALKSLAVALVPRRSAALLRWRVPGLTPVWDGVRARAGLVVVHYKTALTALNGLDPETCFVETHDLLWLKQAKLTQASPLSVAALRRLRGEMAALDATRGIIAISPSEAAVFRMLLDRAATFYVSRWTAPRQAAGGAGPAPGAARFDLVFVASAYAMNARGLAAAFAQHGAWLSRYRVAVCGGVCDDPAVVALARHHPGVTLLGFVEDLRSLYGGCKAALVPVDGTGLKMKLVSALEAGLPVLATPPVFAGLPDGHEGAVLPLGAGPAASLLEDPVALQAARRAAVRYLERFTAAGDAEAALDAMAAVIRADAVPDGSAPDPGAVAALA